MAENTTTISLPPPLKKRAQKAAEQMFNSKHKLSTYIQFLVSSDCDKKKIK